MKRKTSCLCTSPGGGGRPAGHGGRHLAARTRAGMIEPRRNANVHSAGRDARLHGRRDARRYFSACRRMLFLWLMLGCGAGAFGAGHVDLTRLQCGNLIYSGNKSSVCFSDKFLSDVARDTSLSVGKNFCPVKLDSDGLFDYPFCVFSGNDSFTLPQKERDNLKKYLLNGGFILASPGCSDEKWDASFRRELKICFPEYKLARIPMTHPVFSVVNRLTRLVDKHGVPVTLEGLEINGRLVAIYSKEGLNDVAHAQGCCCCGGNEITDPAKVNINIFTYSLLY